MDQKLDSNEYLISKNQANEQVQGIQQGGHQRNISYVMVDPNENVLGSPISHPSFQYKNRGITSADSSHPGQLDQVQQSMQNYNSQIPFNFEYQQRQYPGQSVQHQMPQHMNYQVPGLIQNQHMHYQTQMTQLRSTMPATPGSNILQGKELTLSENKSPIPSRAHTPIENISYNDLSNTLSAGRKRARKSDHAVTGDEGDSELKQLAFKASDLPLSELAMRIRNIENNQSLSDMKYSANEENSRERQRQIFGMVWLLGSCESSPTAVVPRNRIYARYVQICADNGLAPLSPASFGKLVRILFPNLKTRRLGMRGQSKYHYCGIKLVGDQNFQSAQSPASTNSSNFGLESPQSPHVHTPSLGGSPRVTSNLSTPSTTISLSEQFQVQNLKFIPNIFNLIDYSLSKENMNLPLNLPSIYPYLSRDVDYDIADTLYSLYKVHCSSIFESLRYMHVRKLFTSFSSFNSILTSPVFKLYTSDSVLEWVRKCDNVMYTTMGKMLSKLHLQNIPEEVLSQLKQISRQYVEKLSLSLQNKVPKNFVIMKLKGAKEFITILLRLIRVIETGNSASRVFSNSTETGAMINDWNKLDISEIALREIPCSKENVDSLILILNNDLQKAFSEFKVWSKSESSGDNIACPSLQYAASFISSLPSKFTNVNPRLFILVASNFLTTCLREMSLSGASGFGAWWIVRCWFDEYLSWCLELGGFLSDDLDGIDISELDFTNKDASMNTSIDHMRPVSLVEDHTTSDLLMNFEGLGSENILAKDEDNLLG